MRLDPERLLSQRDFIVSAAKATQIDFVSVKTPQMRVFHVTWMAFFLCFFGWFGLAPMLSVIRQDLGLTTDQIVTTNMWAVASCVLMRFIIGWLCDSVGPRITYSALLVLGAIPVMCVGFVGDYTSFLLMRIAIGMLGASFVITQFHTSQMFAPNCVGFANALTAGWGNSGAGAVHFLMPVLMTTAAAMLGSESLGWRAAMVVPGVLLLLMGVVYFLLTQDAPGGSFAELRAKNQMPPKKDAAGAFWEAFRDPRAWMLFFIYGACFGIELVIDSKIALYLTDYFEMSVGMSGLIGGLFGAMGLFARPLGGWIADRAGRAGGLRGRVLWMFLALLGQGVLLMAFSQMRGTGSIIALLGVTGLFVHMACGATYAVVPFINKRATGAVSGIVGAGGNAMAVTLMFLFKPDLVGFGWPVAFFVMGAVTVIVAFASFAVRFSEEAEAEFRVGQTPPVPQAA